MLIQPMKPEKLQSDTKIRCFCFCQHELLISDELTLQIPILDWQTFRENVTLQRYLGEWGGFPCYVGDWGERPIPPGWKSYPLRQLFNRIDAAVLQQAGRAFHLLHWDQTHRFCGRCGSATADSSAETAKICPQCGQMIFPRISPAMIVAIIHDGQILLARANRFPAAFYSVIAGFVEPGETLEDCVRREVREEVGVEVSKIRYFGSQPWPYPDSLMIAFTAEYAGGDLVIDGEEIVAADWFRPDNLPQIPEKISIARQMIDWFVANHSAKTGLCQTQEVDGEKAD